MMISQWSRFPIDGFIAMVWLRRKKSNRIQFGLVQINLFYQLRTSQDHWKLMQFGSPIHQTELTFFQPKLQSFLYFSFLYWDGPKSQPCGGQWTMLLMVSEPKKCSTPSINVVIFETLMVLFSIVQIVSDHLRFWVGLSCRPLVCSLGCVIQLLGLVVWWSSTSQWVSLLSHGLDSFSSVKRFCFSCCLYARSGFRHHPQILVSIEEIKSWVVAHLIGN